MIISYARSRIGIQQFAKELRRMTIDPPMILFGQHNLVNHLIVIIDDADIIH